MKAYHNKEKGIGIIYDDIYLVNGARTPFGKFCGTLGQVSPIDLGIFSSRAAIEKSGITAHDIDQAIIANIGQACGDAYFLPRHIALFAGLHEAVPALMVQRICASGFETIITGSEQITLGKADTVLCCGTENMSLAPTVSFGGRMGYPLGQLQFLDMLWVALDDTAAGCAMGSTAENVAKKFGITRAEVDEFALRSYTKALEATARGFFKDEIVALNSTVFEIEGLKSRKVRLPRGVENFIADENVRATTLEQLGKLTSVFAKDGVQSAGNSSGIVDGSAAVIVAGKNSVQQKNLKPIAKVLASATCGIDPKFMGLGPVPAIKLLLEMTGLKIDDIGLIEINEAFGAQFIGCERELGFDRERANVNGGAIAFGHPLAASGTRISLTLARTMNERNVKYGIGSACIGGGQGTAVLYENCNL